MNKKLCVIGLGYIGLPTSAIFANSGWEVTGVDINPTAVEKLNNGEIHIEEVGLGELVKTVVDKGNLKASMAPVNADCYIITVPTPHNIDNTVNLNHVIDAVKSITPYLRKGNVVIVESTIPPKTMDEVVSPLFEKVGWSVGEDIYLAHCPERVLPGRILIELVENTRIVGGVNQVSTKKAVEVYKSIVTGEILTTSAISAEMSKLMENTYRDVNIALANELVKISKKLDVDALEVIELANYHPRVNIHQPGPGVGGHCLAVDPYFIIEKAPEESKLIKMAREINNSMPLFVKDLIKEFLPDTNSKITILGLTYKGNIDDVRESPALEIVNLLENEGYRLGIYDPHIKQEQINYYLSTFEEAVKGTSCVLVLTDHNEFRSLEKELVNYNMKDVLVLDTKNCVAVYNDNIRYINFGNLSELKKKEVTPLILN
ncbi:nucleotide sugar dehydrogenase [Siminovitchia terrae]|uniref:Nucleotide sugar dehydrogenase n=1 Tax=Siminovitchia terrae TaxID=1914933 RepID=A0A429X850_SIMTE|nr:nucleotide sugar dehydrogenase [Siminovitchia terrae]RST59500.1 nucleotide sugar dehydrogenase [Siminovitchia terrae]